MFDRCKVDNPHEADSGSAALKTQVVNHQFRPKNLLCKNPGASYICYRCGIPNHFWKDCREILSQNKTGFGSKGKFGNFGGKENGNHRNVATNKTEVADEEVSSFQVRVISSNISTVKSDPGNAEELRWILDSGCTDNIVSSDKYFFW